MGSFDAIKATGAAVNATSIAKNSGLTRNVEKKTVDLGLGGKVEHDGLTTFTTVPTNTYTAKNNPFSSEYTDAIADGLRNSSDRKAFMLKLLSSC